MALPISDPTTSTEAEPVAFEKDRLVLKAFDGSEVTIESPRRLSNYVRFDGRIYELRGVDYQGGHWLRIYREVVVDDVRIAEVRT